MSVQADQFTVHATQSSRDAAAALERLDQEIADLDAEILATVQRRVELARRLPAPSDTADFGELGPDGDALVRMMARLAAPA